MFNWADYPSPLGTLKLVAHRNRLAAILWAAERPGRVRLGELQHSPHDPVLADVARQLGEYFAGQRRVFQVEVGFIGTAFQRAVWQALLAIPFGETRTYRQLAEAIGAPSASRAVGAANGRNPVSIIAPCHRVIGADGSLTGFAGGLPAKAWLLQHEGLAAPQLALAL